MTFKGKSSNGSEWAMYAMFHSNEPFFTRSIRIIELEKKQCFTVVKWRFFMLFFSLLVSFNYGSIFFRPSKLKSVMDPHIFVFLVLSFSLLELRGAHFVLFQRSLEKGIIYCVSTGILM